MRIKSGKPGRAVLRAVLCQVVPLDIKTFPEDPGDIV
jgi:hypothetical protein